MPRRWLRGVAVAALVVATVALVVLQVMADAVLRDQARGLSLIARLPRDADDVLFGRGTGRAPTPALRLMLARRAVEERDPALAERRLHDLPPGRDRSQLEGMLAEQRGDHAEALHAYLLAGDLAGLEREEGRVTASGDTRGAVLLQREIVRHLEEDKTQPDALAEAWWRLGVAEQLDGYMHYPISDRRPWALRSLAAYEQAVALAPLSERYLVSAGNQELNVGDVAAAERYFQRARDVDPTSAQTWVGLANVALRRNDRAAARRFMERARRIAPNAPAVKRLEAALRP